jgi:predicted PurR-regulated permease PerM
MKIRFWEIVVLLFLGLIISSTILVPYLKFETWTVRGQFGDMFNVVNATASLLATLVALFTLFYYGKEIASQNRKMNETRNRQLNIENNLLAISKTLELIEKRNEAALIIRSVLEQIDLKKEDILRAKKNKLSNTKINRLENELTSLKIKLNTNLEKM